MNLTTKKRKFVQIIKLQNKIFNIENEKGSNGEVQPGDQIKPIKPLSTMSFINIKSENDLLAEIKENYLKNDGSKFDFIDYDEEGSIILESITGKSNQSSEWSDRNVERSEYNKTSLRMLAEKLKDMSAHAREIESCLKDRDKKLEKVMESLEDAKGKLKKKDDIIKQLQSGTKSNSNQQLIGSKNVKKKSKTNKPKSVLKIIKSSKIKLESNTHHEKKDLFTDNLSSKSTYLFVNNNINKLGKIFPTKNKQVNSFVAVTKLQFDYKQKSLLTNVF